jgi:hypothetical protein
MPDVKHIDPPLLLPNAIDHPVHMRQIPIQEVTKPRILWSFRRSPGMLFQAQDCILQPSIPCDRCLRVLGVYRCIKTRKIPLGPGRQANEICHVSLQTL